MAISCNYCEIATEATRPRNDRIKNKITTFMMIENKAVKDGLSRYLAEINAHTISGVCKRVALTS